MRTRLATLYNLLKASRCIGLPNHELTSRSSSIQLSVSGTLSESTGLTLSQISVGVEKVILRALAQAGKALRNSRILLDKG